ALGQGSHAYSVSAADAAGNVSAASPSITIIVDTIAPGAPGNLEVYGRVFMQIGIATAVIAVLMLLTAPKLNRMTQDDDTAEKGSKAATV
ncbi:hypothetical protein ONN28_13910, partial [Salmonella enterica subsp. enterica serovar Newport]|nr:hypothetical protein [Salmonella enterica subsp. enterica serovar Newport]